MIWLEFLFGTIIPLTYKYESTSVLTIRNQEEEWHYETSGVLETKLSTKMLAVLGYGWFSKWNTV